MTIQRPRSSRWLLVCGGVLIGAIATGTALMTDYFRERALTNSNRELGNTALLLARHLDQELEGLELAQKMLVEHMRSAGIASREDFEREMSTRDAHLLLRAQIGRDKRDPRIATIALLSGRSTTTLGVLGRLLCLAGQPGLAYAIKKAILGIARSATISARSVAFGVNASQ